jgi:hypothetical protein
MEAGMSRLCVVCEAGTVDDPRRAACEACKVVHEHVVSNHTTTGGWAATCRCGWHVAFPASREGRDAREAAIVEHWRAVAGRTP